MARSNPGKQRGSVLRRLEEELELFFVNELVDERLDGVDFTAYAMSPDKKVVTVHYLPPEGREDDVLAALEGLRPIVEARAADVLHKSPEVRFRYDRGAGNHRRVGEILDELRARGDLPPAD